MARNPPGGQGSPPLLKSDAQRHFRSTREAVGSEPSEKVSTSGSDIKCEERKLLHQVCGSANMFEKGHEILKGIVLVGCRHVYTSCEFKSTSCWCREGPSASNHEFLQLW